MYLAHKAGLRVFATGGLGGVNPAHAGQPLDISADLTELASSPGRGWSVPGAQKSILDLAATLERLETDSVPVVGYGVDTFPAFYVRDSGLPLSVRGRHAGGAGSLCAAALGPGRSQRRPRPASRARTRALDQAEFAALQRTAEDEAEQGRRTPVRP